MNKNIAKKPVVKKPTMSRYAVPPNAKQILKTVYETPGFINKLKLGDPFQLISILGYANNDNIDKYRYENRQPIELAIQLP